MFFGSSIRCFDARARLTPSLVFIEPTIRCNLRCPMCDLSVRSRAASDLNLPRFKEILKGLPFVHHIHLQGIGEPLLNRNFCKMIRFASNRGISVSTFTNGTLITDSLANELLSSGLQELWFSLDAATQETYEAIRVGASYSKVIENIQLIVRMKGKRKSPRIGIWFVAMRKNICELDLLIDLASSLGVKTVSVEGVGDWGKRDVQRRLRTRDLELDITPAKSYLDTAIDKARYAGIVLRIGPNLTPAVPGSLFATCWWPWWSCNITVEGYVTPCCRRPDPRQFNFGNIFREKFETIWNSPPYRSFRAGLSSGRPPEICKGCPLAAKVGGGSY